MALSRPQSLASDQDLPCPARRTLSLDNILLLLSCVLRESQVLVLCPILSKLSSCLLGLLPLLQPFTWHHLHLPVVPLAPLALQPGQPPRVLGFQLLQATCPFLLGFPVTDAEALFAMCEVSALLQLDSIFRGLGSWPHAVLRCCRETWSDLLLLLVGSDQC
jgi:hypothetical protein